MSACGGRVEGGSSIGQALPPGEGGQALEGIGAASGSAGIGGTSFASAVGAAGSDTSSAVESCTSGAMPMEELPRCAYIDTCYSPGSWFWPCTSTFDCAFTFDKPLDYLGAVNVGCQTFYAEYVFGPPQFWVFSEDRNTVVLIGAACDAWRDQNGPQVIIESFVHSCVL